jgi:hypothetical protein
MSLHGHFYAALSLVLAAAVGVSTGCAQGSNASANRPRPPSASSSVRESPSCVPPAFRLLGPRPPLPKELSTALDDRIVSSFAVFRRAPQARDKPRDLDAASGGLSRALGKYYELASYYPAYVRRLIESRGGEPSFVIAAFARSERVPPARCLPTGARAVRVEQERRRSVEPVFCIVQVGSAGTRPSGCEPFAQVAASFRAFHASDFLGRVPTIEMVPDGVAWVRITYRDASPLTVPVIENAFVFVPPPTPRDRLDAYLRSLLPKLSGEHVTNAERLAATKAWNRVFSDTYPSRIEWLDSDRRVLRSISPPTEKSTAATSLGDLRAPVRG